MRYNSRFKNKVRNCAFAFCAHRLVYGTKNYELNSRIRLIQNDHYGRLRLTWLDTIITSFNIIQMAICLNFWTSFFFNNVYHLKYIYSSISYCLSSIILTSNWRVPLKMCGHLNIYWYESLDANEDKISHEQIQ